MSGVALGIKLVQVDALRCLMLGVELLSKPECSPVNQSTAWLCYSAGAIESVSYRGFFLHKNYLLVVRCSVSCF